MSDTHTAYYQSDLGLLEIKGGKAGIQSVSFVEEAASDSREIHPCLQACVRQLDEYFQGRRTEFSIPLQLQGTDFQQKAWRQITQIPFGATRSYADIAAQLGNSKAVRAVGNANGKNKIAIIIPCHRVVGSDGQLTGYGGGLWRKAWLLNHERQLARSFPPAN